MKVFCPEHKKGFFAPRQSPIKCENRGHVLGELDFAGAAGSQVVLQWQYCCNCEHFCPISTEGESLERCPVCTRRSSLLYVCDRCFTISFESSTPLDTKNFTLNAEGLPQPSCPGCLQESSGEVREHICDELGASFSTALNTCPICREQLDVGPSFPNLVARYLRKTKAADKFKVTFDYDSGLFVEVGDGEFVIVAGDGQSKQAIVLPRLTHFSGTREFYELYQDYYHHSSEMRAGEVLIHEPAVAERSGAGWKFQSAGLLEVVDEQPSTKARHKIRLGEVESPAEEQSEAPIAATSRERIKPGEIETAAPELLDPPPAKPNEGTPGTVCSQCGSLVEQRYAFCWHCGQAMKRGQSDREPVRATSARRLVIDMDDGSTAQGDSAEAKLSMFSSEVRNEPKKFSRSANPALKLMVMIIITGVALLLGLVGVAFVKSLVGRANNGLVSQAASPNLPPAQSPVPTVEATDSPAPDQNQVKPTGTAEDGLRKLRQRRAAASASDRLALLRDCATLEKEYPTDYRFPYERARLAVMGPTAKSAEPAFQALQLAAERAIHAGKARNMLQSLDNDRFGEFRKLSQGHLEWAQIVQALKRRDVSLLSANARLARMF